MEKIPCEFIIWNVLPAIRKEFVKSLIKNYSLSQKQISEIIKLTPAAISQYLSDKRGGIEITDKNILNEIDKSVRNIYKNGSSQLPIETCRICNLLKTSNIISKKLGYSINNEFSCGGAICKDNELVYENTVWNILPAIRSELAKILIKKHKLTQRKVASLLGITEAAVSRYLAGKRGLFEISDITILKEISKSAGRIIKGDYKTMAIEICRICTLIKTKGI
jgi:predicted transcriptional regulator